MQKLWIFVIACVFFSSTGTVLAASPTAGVNAFFDTWPASGITGDVFHNQEQQLLDQLQAANVRLIRTDLNNGSALYDQWPDKVPPHGVPGYIFHAFQKGIGTVLIIGPSYYKNGACLRPIDMRLPGQQWASKCLSQLDLESWNASVHSTKMGQSTFALLDVLDKEQGVTFAALELMNEINWGYSNADFFAYGTGDLTTPAASHCPVNPQTGEAHFGRILSLADLMNPQDVEGRSLAAGFKNYVALFAALKDWRDHSLHNRQTPIISAGMSDFGSPTHQFDDRWNNCIDTVSAPDTIAFMRANGLDNYVDGYGIHTYPPALNPDGHAVSSTERLTTLEQRTFHACLDKTGKPCWLTEWGFHTFPNWPKGTCPLNASTDPSYEATSNMRMALQSFAEKHPDKLAAELYFEWQWISGNKTEWGVYGDFPFCSANGGSITGETASGKIVLAPFAP